MPIEPKLAQDVWKDVGSHVQFTVLKFKREHPDSDRELMQDFFDRYQALLRSLRIRAAEDNLKAAFGISNTGWDYLFPDTVKPKELVTYETMSGPQYSMPASEGDLFFHIRAKNEAVVYEAQSIIRDFLKDITEVVDETKGFRYFEGRAIIGFIDGTEAPSEDDAAEYALIGDEDPKFINGSYAFAQKWIHDMDSWNAMPVEEQERAVGRRKFNDVELDDDEKMKNAHNVSSKIDFDGEEQKIIRMNVPFSQPAQGITGTYFMGYSRHWTVTRAMMEQMLETGDFLLTFSKIVSGQIFFIPSREMLDRMAEGDF